MGKTYFFGMIFGLGEFPLVSSITGYIIYVFLKIGPFTSWASGKMVNGHGKFRGGGDILYGSSNYLSK